MPVLSMNLFSKKHLPKANPSGAKTGKHHKSNSEKEEDPGAETPGSKEGEMKINDQISHADRNGKIFFKVFFILTQSIFLVNSQNARNLMEIIVLFHYILPHHSYF